MKTVLFVTYGSGHVRMVVPVARALAAGGQVRVRVLALTTAAAVVEAAGLETLRFRDFVRAGDEAALVHGRRLLAAMSGPVADPEESVAYLGLCYAELVEDVGAEEAARLYARDGRQAFLPLRVLERIVGAVGPDLLFATNSPRAERAAVVAARRLGLPAICLVDLFCLDEVKWIGAADFADRVCVLNPSVRDFLVGAGRRPAQISVTGNPAFDALTETAHREAGSALRRAAGWDGKKVLLWPTQVEPAFHPFNGRPGDPTLPGRALAQVIAWVLARDDVVLCVRPRAGEAPPPLPADPRVQLAGQQLALADLLNAVDLVVTLNSTVGLEGHLAGTRLLQVLGSVFDEAMPLLAYGVADAAVPVEAIPAALERCVALPRRGATKGARKATDAVLAVIREFL